MFNCDGIVCTCEINKNRKNVTEVKINTVKLVLLCLKKKIRHMFVLLTKNQK